MTARVVVVGSCNIDLVARTASLPRAGETVVGSSLATIVGGKGANQAITAARGGASCSMVGAVGDDPYAAVITETLRASGVDTRGLRTLSGPSGTALIVVDEAGENTIVVVGGANAGLISLTDADTTTVDGADALLLQLEVPLAVSRDAAARSRGLRVLNAAPARSLPTDFLRLIDLLVVNEGEARTLAATRSGDSVAALLDLVPRVAITLGARGARYADRDGLRLSVAAPKVTAVDTTAAGDTFAGMLAVGLAERRPVQEALELACAAASLCVETIGASTSIPFRIATDARWAAAYGAPRAR